MPAGLTGEPPGLLRDTAARFGTTDRAIGQRVQRVEAAGRRLPLDPGLEYEVTRPSLPGENHLMRKRSARMACSEVVKSALATIRPASSRARFKAV
jgi:hypothetical protein